MSDENKNKTIPISEAKRDPLRICDEEIEVLRETGAIGAEIIEALGVMKLLTAFNRFSDSREVDLGF